MKYSDYRFSLDVQMHQAQVSVPVKLGDTARRLCISLTDGRTSYIIAEGCIATFNAKKPDGATLKNYCIIEKNTIIYEFTEQTTNVEGVVNCDITIYDTEGKVLYSPQFILIVDKNVVKDEAVSASEDEATALTHIILTSEPQRIANEGARQEAESERIASENERISNELSRVEAEAERASSEELRGTYERARERAEEERLLAEELRATAETSRASKELSRISAESSRDADEIDRRYAEVARATAESLRAKNFNAQMSEMQARYDNFMVSQRIKTRNLADLAFENAIITATGAYQKESTGVSAAASPTYISVTGGQTYTVSWKKNEKVSYIYVHEYTADNTRIKTTRLGDIKAISTYTITLDSSCAYIRIHFYAENEPWENLVAKNLQIELGTEATSYIRPYVIEQANLDLEGIARTADLEVIKANLREVLDEIIEIQKTLIGGGA